MYWNYTRRKNILSTDQTIKDKSKFDLLIAK